MYRGIAITGFIAAALVLWARTGSATDISSGSELSVTVMNVDSVESVPQGASHVPMLSLLLAASCDGDITVRSLRLRRSGVGSADDIDRVYLVSGFRRVSNTLKPRPRDHVVELLLKRFTVPSCDVVRLDVEADMSATALIASEHRFALTDSQAIDSTATKITITADAATLPLRTTPASLGSVQINFLPLVGRVSFGLQRVVARLQLAADNVSDHAIRSLTLKNDGTAHDYDLVNLFLENARQQRISIIAAHMDRDVVSLQFNPPFELKRSEMRLLTLRADVRASVTHTIHFLLEDPADLDARRIHSRDKS